MSVPWRFEYVDTSYELDHLHPERSEVVEVKHFISVLEVFKHHYTGELMYKVREDYVKPCGVPVSREYILTEPAILNMLKEKRVTDHVYDYDWQSTYPSLIKPEF